MIERTPYRNVEVPVLKVQLEFEDGVLPVHICGEVLLGRRTFSEEFVIDLSDQDAFALGVSRIHAALIYDGENIMIEDRGSDEGTRLNGNLLMPFQPYVIREGDTITLGRLMFGFCTNFR